MAIVFENLQIIRNAKLGAPYELLEEIAIYLRNYLEEFRNPSFYTYRLDGNGYYINDGGGDMFDNPGNVTTPWLKNNIQKTINLGSFSNSLYPSASNYLQTGSVGTLDDDFKYISLGYTQYRTISPATQSMEWHPLTVIGSRVGNGSVGYQTSGNSGADGFGSLIAQSIYSGSLVYGFETHTYYRQQYGTTDPSHCNVYILVGHSNWGSNFGTVKTFNDNSKSQQGGALYSSGSETSNLLTAHMLLSKPSGQQISQLEIKTVVDNFIFRVKSALNY